MFMESVNSTNLKAVGYNPITETLTIKFKNGRTYEYYHVPLRVYGGLMSSQSKGKYHHRHIKNSYRYHRIQ